MQVSSNKNNCLFFGILQVIIYALSTTALFFFHFDFSMIILYIKSERGEEVKF